MLNPDEQPRHVLFYDGVCGLCTRTVQFVLRRDLYDRFRFAALQSEYARSVLTAHHRNPDDLDTMIVMSSAGVIYDRGRAAMFVLQELGGVWKVFSWLRCLPRALLDWGYDRVANSRYRLFGRHDVCLVPSAAQQQKFVAHAKEP